MRVEQSRRIAEREREDDGHHEPGIGHTNFTHQQPLQRRVTVRQSD